MRIFIKGLLTGLFLQLAIGPVFFFIVNLTLQKTVLDGIVAVFAVTLVDYIYIALAIIGVGKLLEKKKVKKIFGVVSSIVLAVFGAFIIKNALADDLSVGATVFSTNLLAGFTSVFLLTILNPMTVVFFTGLFAAKAVENNFKKSELVAFGLGTGFATFVFMGTAVIFMAGFKESVPIALIQILNIIVGALLVAYGAMRLLKVSRNRA